jgi:ABC-type nitrate/sulfonate/bicarbonate transport system substrate-binding protein
MGTAATQDGKRSWSGLRRSITVAAAVTAIGVLAACSSPEPSGSDDEGFGKAGIALSWIKNYEFAGYFVADKNGYYDDSGFDEVDIIAGGGETNSWDTVLANNAMFGLASDLLGVSTAIKQGADLVVVGAQYVDSPVGIVSLEGNPIRSLDDMKGKTFGVDSGGMAVVTALLKANDLPADYVSFESVPNGIEPLMGGQVDALVGFLTNYPVAVAEAGGSPVVLTYSEAGFPQVGDAIVVTRDTLENHRDELKALLTAAIRGWNDALADEDLVVDVAMEYGAGNDLQESLQRASAGVQPSFMITEDTAENGLFTITDELAAGSITSLEALGVEIGEDELFDLSLLEEIYEENPDLIPGFEVPAK